MRVDVNTSNNRRALTLRWVKYLEQALCLHEDRRRREAGPVANMYLRSSLSRYIRRRGDNDEHIHTRTEEHHQRMLGGP